MLTTVSKEYSNFINVFSLKLAAKLSEYNKINNYIINLIDGKQPLYVPIYSLKPIELETLKMYIDINLANNFITPSKSSIGTPILFI